jgi:hypothetical protein
MVVHIVPTTANYLRFLAFLVNGSYAPVVLMPRLQWYNTTIYSILIQCILVFYSIE